MLNYIAAAAIAVMMVLTFLDVTFRAFGHPILGTYEIVSFLGAVAVSFAIAKTTFGGEHIAVKIVMQRLPARTRSITGVVTQLITIALFAVVAWQCAVHGADLYRCKQVSGTVGLPYYPILFGMAFTFATVCLVAVVRITNPAARSDRSRAGDD